MSNSKKTLSVIVKSVFIGIIYVLINYMLKILFGLTDRSISETFISEIIILFTSGLIIGIVYGIIAINLDISRTNQMISWCLIIFINMCTVIIEAVFYSNTEMNIIEILIQQLIIAVILSILIAILFVHKVDRKDLRKKLNNPILNMSILPILFVVLYLISGSINYYFFTDVLYESMQDFVEPTNPIIIIGVEYVNGLLMILSLLPILIFANREKKLYFICGLILFISGGVVPIIQNTSYTMMFKILTLVEIFIQKFIYGYIVSKSLLKTKID